MLISQQHHSPEYSCLFGVKLIMACVSIEIISVSNPNAAPVTTTRSFYGKPTHKYCNISCIGDAKPKSQITTGLMSNDTQKFQYL